MALPPPPGVDVWQGFVCFSQAAAVALEATSIHPISFVFLTLAMPYASLADLDKLPACPETSFQALLLREPRW